jgi:site-specific recombinase XerD
MLEDYYVNPATVDRVRASWLAPQIESYLEWLEAHRYSRLVVYRRLPLLFHFTEFTKDKGCRDIASCKPYIKEFVSEWLELHGAKAKKTVAVRKHAIDAECGVRQMLQLACNEPVTRNRRRRPFPFESEVPGFAEYLRNERGFAESTIRNYRRHLSEFAQYLSQTGITSFSQLSPAVLASFIVQYRPKVAPRTRLGFCCHLRVLLRFCYREGITTRDLSGAVGTPQIYRLNDVPRSITWDEVRRMLEAVERRTIRGRRDYAILLLLVTYGLRAHEVARLTLEDVDWKRERLQVLARKAGHATVYPLAGVVAEAIIDYLKHGRPKTEDRHLFFRIYAPQAPITPAAVSSSVALYLHKAAFKYAGSGRTPFAITCVQRLIDAEFPLKTICDYVGHRSP